MTGPRHCTDKTHRHVLMCPVQAAQIASLAVMAGMARRDDGIGLAWWGLGLRELRYADAEIAMRDLVAGGVGERSWITARDVIRRARAIRAGRHARAPEPVPPAGLEDDEELGEEERRARFVARQKFTRWYWVAVGNGEPPGRALELAAGTVGMDRYVEAVAPDTGEPISEEAMARVRAVIEQRKERGDA